MEHMIDDQPSDKVINAAVSDAIVRLRKMTNNHPTLEAGTPFRKSVVKTLRKHLSSASAFSEPVTITVGSDAFHLTFENFRVTGVQRARAEAA